MTNLLQCLLHLWLQNLWLSHLWLLQLLPIDASSKRRSPRLLLLLQSVKMLLFIQRLKIVKI